jgi:hypothetical protein
VEKVFFIDVLAVLEDKREEWRQFTLIKRSLLDTGGERHVGFSVAVYEEIFSVR